MSVRVDPSLLHELKEYGAVGIEKCFNCGSCTAVCSMTSNEDQFPRKIIRMAQLGMRDQLLGSKELWLCYNCGECSETCPQQAEPANFMSAARCYAITHYDPLGLGKLFCRIPVLGGLVAIGMVLFFGVFMYTQRGTISTASLKLFNFIPYELIHNVGLGAIVLIGLASLLAIFNMISRMARANDISVKGFVNASRMNWFAALWDALGVQSLGQKRYREECDTPENTKAWYLSKWFVHAATMWGFLGLLSATALDYLLDILGLKPTGTAVPIWYPTRFIGTLAGPLFTYGVSTLLIKRWRAVDKAHGYSRPSDWIFLTLLWFSGITGFVIEIALYLPQPPMWAYWMFLFHVAVSMTLLLLLPFTKFAHSLYRIIALYFHALTPVPATEMSKAGTD
jgi:ferredoxin